MGDVTHSRFPSPTVDRLLCAHCQEPIEVSGFRFRHVLDDAVSCNRTDGGTSVATPQFLDVVWVRYGDGLGSSESYHVMVDEVEYVLWRHRAEVGARALWSAWRTELPTPHLSLYYDTPSPEQGRSRVTDPRQLTANMPPLVAYWLMDKVEPF